MVVLRAFGLQLAAAKLTAAKVKAVKTERNPLIVVARDWDLRTDME